MTVILIFILSDHADGYDAAAFDGNISVKGPSEHV
jgi:hypothetical protein